MPGAFLCEPLFISIFAGIHGEKSPRFWEKVLT